MSFDDAHPHRWLFGDVTSVTLERVLWILVGVSLVGDIATTFIGLHLGLSESNPIARSAMYSYGVWGMIVLKAFAVSVGLVCRMMLTEKYRAIIPAGLAIPWTIAMWLNIYIISTAV